MSNEFWVICSLRKPGEELLGGRKVIGRLDCISLE
jgi:hypothetical protein